MPPLARMPEVSMEAPQGRVAHWEEQGLGGRQNPGASRKPLQTALGGSKGCYVFVVVVLAPLDSPAAFARYSADH
eukprot:14331068-Alexandrium_andersonii.AAC.1